MLNEVIKHFEKFCFVNLKLKGKKVESFMYGPPGELLIENIKREWLYNVSLYRENNVYLFHDGDKSADFIKDNIESFLMAKEFNNSTVPFGIVETRSIDHEDSICADPVHPRINTLLRYFGFFKPSEAEQFFCRWQLQRKRWWRKFSNDPGKFAFAEDSRTPDGVKSQSIILAKFPWGEYEIETVKYHGDHLFKGLSNNLLTRLQVVEGKKKYLPHVIESRCSLDYAFWTYLCDAYFKEKKENKPVVRLHKKLAPFKFTAAASFVNKNILKQIIDLSHLILLELRKEGISCLLPVTPPFGTNALELQLARSRSLGIPYTAILTEDTLQTGIFELYSRETTLQEQVHLSKIREYGQILMTA